MRFLFILTILFLISSKVAFAQIEIHEIMYDLEGSDAKREWIEVKNKGGQDVDLSTWKIYEGTSSSKGNRSINEFQGGVILGAGLYAVIASDAATFLLDWPTYTGQLFDSTFSSLTNTGEPLVLRDENLADINTVNYQSEWGAGGDGNSLQLVSGEWFAGSPTPGGANTASTEAPPSPNDMSEPNEPTEEDQGVQTIPASSSFPVEPKITAHAEGSSVVVVGADTEFRGESFGLKNKPLANARYVWNMGNGELKEGKAILHSYQYPGEYVVTLAVSSGQYTASDRLIVTATEAKVSISKANTDLIELMNGSGVELNLSWWMLRAGKESFTIPKNTLILAGKTLVFSNNITKLTISNPYEVTLLYPNGVTAYRYGSDANINEQISIDIEKTVSVPTQTVAATEKKETLTTNNAESFTAKTVAEEEILLEKGQALDSEQIASPLSGAGQAGENGNSSIYKWLLALVSIISIAVIGVLLGRRHTDNDEIKILD